MKAKEMFEKLKLEYRSIDYKKDEILEIQYSNGNGTRITISKKRIEYVENYNRKDLPMEFLKAINKQIEELGWEVD